MSNASNNSDKWNCGPIELGQQLSMYPSGETCKTCGAPLNSYNRFNVCLKCQSSGVVGEERKPQKKI